MAKAVVEHKITSTDIMRMESFVKDTVWLKVYGAIILSLPGDCGHGRTGAGTCIGGDLVSSELRNASGSRARRWLRFSMASRVWFCSMVVVVALCAFVLLLNYSSKRTGSTFSQGNGTNTPGYTKVGAPPLALDVAVHPQDSNKVKVVYFSE